MAIDKDCCKQIAELEYRNRLTLIGLNDRYNNRYNNGYRHDDHDRYDGHGGYHRDHCCNDIFERNVLPDDYYCRCGCKSGWDNGRYNK